MIIGASLVLVGFFLVFGIVGTSDCESFSRFLTTPFSDLVLWSTIGLLLVLLGVRSMKGEEKNGKGK